MELPQTREDLVADQSALRSRVARVRPKWKPLATAVLTGVFPPEREKRPHDAVLAPGLDPANRPARGQAVEDRLDLVASRVPGRAEPLARVRVPNLAQLSFRRGSRRVDHVRPH